MHNSLQQVFWYDDAREWRKTLEAFEESGGSKLTAVRKERENLQKALKDFQAWEQDTLLPQAQARIHLDLDDIVKVNYLKFEGAVQTIPGLAAKEE